MEHTSNNELIKMQEELQALCMQFDPFSEDVNKETKDLLEKLNLSEDSKNPFQFTNKVLKLLDDLEAEINNRKLH